MEEKKDIQNELSHKENEELTAIDAVMSEEEEKGPESEDYGATLNLDYEDHEEDKEPSGEETVPQESPIPQAVAKGSKKKLWIILGAVVAVLLVAYGGGVYFYSSHFFANTNMNGLDASNKTTTEVEAMIKGNASDYTLTLQERGGKTETITATAISLKYSDASHIEEQLAAQNAWAWPMAFFKGPDANMQEAYTYDKAKLSSVIDQLKGISSTDIVAAANAQPVYENGTITIKQEVAGNQLDRTKFTEAVQKAIASGRTTLDLESAGCYTAPKYTTESAEVQKAKTTMEKYLKSVVTYTFGNQNEVLDSATIGSWLSVDDSMNVAIDQEKAKAYLATLGEKYDTIGGSHGFTTSGGSRITVSGGSYGWCIDEAAELEALIPIIQAGQPVTREPVYSSTALSRDTNNDIGNTYVEISLGGQTMWLYVDGQLVVSTPVVTGSVAAGYGTPSGVYAIVYKATDTVLKGDGYASPVNFWMPFDTSRGNGIHDADGWRSSYGGDIYLSGGSHGCVNTPYSATATIFNNVSEGTPVVVY